MNDRCGGSIIHIGSGMGTQGMALTASTIMEIANLVQQVWEEQLKATLKDA